MPEPSTEQLLKRWQARLIGRLCRVTSRAHLHDTRGPLVVALVGLHGNDNSEPIFRVEDAQRNQCWYFGGNDWDVEIWGEGVIHAP